MARHPTQGVEGAKPRIPAGATPNGSPASKEEFAKLSEEYLRTRNLQMGAKAAVAAMELQRRRGELIPRRMAGLEAAFLLTAFRQNLLGSPVAIARELVVGCSAMLSYAVLSWCLRGVGPVFGQDCGIRKPIT
jgi:hypothetical protein